MLMKPLVAVIPIFCDELVDVLRRTASSVCPKRVASVTGVSPRAFLAWIEAPHMTKYLASSSLAV